MDRKLNAAGPVLSALLLTTGHFVQAQSAPPPPPSASTSSSGDETVVLSPFTVEAQEDRGYRATNTLAGTRIKTELKDVGSAITVVTSEFLRDTGARNNQDLLKYTTNTEVGGLGGNFAGLGNGQQLDDTSARLSPNTNTRVRGLTFADNTRDYFLTDISWDSFNTERVELQRGPNSILFGLGSPAGIINGGLKKAMFKDSNEVEFRYGSYGSARGTVDINKVLLPDELAIRFDALNDKTYYRQDPAFNHDERVYGAARFDPKFLRTPDARTSIRANYEHGKVNANRPRVLPPGDLITPWWGKDINKLTIDPRTVGASDPSQVAAAIAAGDRGVGIRNATLSNGSANPNYNPYIASFGRNYGGLVAVFSDPNSSSFKLMTTDLGTNRGIGLDSSGNIINDKNIGGIPWTIMSGIIPFKDYVGTIGSSRFPNQEYGLYKNYVLMDPTIFDFYNNLLDGPNKREWSNHEAWNAAISQTFFSNRLGFEAAFDGQKYDRGQVNMMSDYGQSITIDINRFLPDGSPNPNLGRAAVVSDSISNNSYESERQSERFTGFGEFKFTDIMERNWLSRGLGRHVFTLLYSKDEVDTENTNWFRYAADQNYGSLINDSQLKNRAIGTVTYLGGSLLNRSSAAGANIPRLTAVQLPQTGSARVFNSTYNSSVDPRSVWIDQFGNRSTQSENPANYVGWTNQNVIVSSSDAGDQRKLTTTAALTKDEITSKAFVWQAFLFDGAVVPTFGYRKDTAKSFSLDAGPQNPDGTINLDSTTYRLPDTPKAIVEGISRSWSWVFHSPQFIKQRLPWGSNISLFYNQSDNFQPAAGRVNALGDVLPAPAGETKDYGFIVSVLDNKISLKVNWYKTSVTNDKLQNFSGDYMLPAAESWGYMFARQNLARIGNFGTGYATAPGQTDTAQAIADGDLVSQAFLNASPGEQFYKTWSIDRTQWNSWMGWTTPPGMTITGDTESKGIEFELMANPTSNWNIALNASKTTAKRLNMAESFAVYVEQRWKTYNTVVPGTGGRAVIGDVRMWTSGYNPGETVRGKFGREFMTPYTLYRLQENSDVPELRPWHFNGVTNYTFNRGILNGVNVGGGVRWQDRQVTGYRLKNTGDPTNPVNYDLKNPYKGPTETNVDAWIGYQRKLTNKLTWRGQVNLRNITTKKELIPVTVQGDGSMAVGRIPETFSWTLSNTFMF